MLSQLLERLELRTRTNVDNTLASSDALPGALWHRSRELHYVAHFREPLDVDVGDIGYITGNPPQFVCLNNVFGEISDGYIQNSRIPTSRYSFSDRWTTETVQGIVRYVFEMMFFMRLTCGHRHSFQFRGHDGMELWDWHSGFLVKDVVLRRINFPIERGLVVDCLLAWNCLAERAKDLAAGHVERTINSSDLILGLLQH
jgi:hypothetical protein